MKIEPPCGVRANTQYVIRNTHSVTLSGAVNRSNNLFSGRIVQHNKSQKKEKRRFFAVASLGKKRWYWVVWPSQVEVQRAANGRHLEEGYEEQKADAIDRALDVAGADAEWLAAKYARDYHRQLRQTKEGKAASASTPLRLEFLYQDVRDGDSGEWRSVAHRVVKKTKKYVYVERQPYGKAAPIYGYFRKALSS